MTRNGQIGIAHIVDSGQVYEMSERIKVKVSAICDWCGKSKDSEFRYKKEDLWLGLEKPVFVRIKLYQYEGKSPFDGDTGAEMTLCKECLSKIEAHYSGLNAGVILTSLTPQGRIEAGLRQIMEEAEQKVK